MTTNGPSVVRSSRAMARVGGKRRRRLSTSRPESVSLVLGLRPHPVPRTWMGIAGPVAMASDRNLLRYCNPSGKLQCPALNKRRLSGRSTNPSLTNRFWAQNQRSAPSESLAPWETICSTSTPPGEDVLRFPTLHLGKKSLGCCRKTRLPAE